MTLTKGQRWAHKYVDAEAWVIGSGNGECMLSFRIGNNEFASVRTPQPDRLLKDFELQVLPTEEF